MMFRPEVHSRRTLLQMMKGVILSSPPVPRGASGVEQAFCADAPGRNVVLSPEEIAYLECGDCKKLSILAARRHIDEGVWRVDICMTVTPPPQDEHVFLRVWATPSSSPVFDDPSVRAGAPIRQIGDYIAETVWVTPPGA